jgi:hypothetical protein
MRLSILLLSCLAIDTAFFAASVLANTVCKQCGVCAPDENPCGKCRIGGVVVDLGRGTSHVGSGNTTKVWEEAGWNVGILESSGYPVTKGKLQIYAAGVRGAHYLAILKFGNLRQEAWYIDGNDKCLSEDVINRSADSFSTVQIHKKG